MNCTVTENTAFFYGGGGLADCSGVNNCVISNNSAEGELHDVMGGGLSSSQVHSMIS